MLNYGWIHPLDNAIGSCPLLHLTDVTKTADCVKPEPGTIMVTIFRPCQGDAARCGCPVSQPPANTDTAAWAALSCTQLSTHHNM